MNLLPNVGALSRVRKRSISRLGLGFLAITFLTTWFQPAGAMDIQTIKSPGGIEAWLVEDHTVPLLALRFAFRGGSAQDPKGKEGVAHFLTAMMDEGAGDLDAQAFQERMEEIAMRMSYDDTRDSFYGSFETLTANRDAAADLLKLALTKTRFDGDALERMREQLKAHLAYTMRDPERVATISWYKNAFPNHPYGSPVRGTPATLDTITADDLRTYKDNVFAKDNLKVVAVGDIDADSLGKFLDYVFGDLPAESSVKPVDETMPVAIGKLDVVEMNVPQSVAMFGTRGLKRKDPDFIPAFVLSHIIGGGGFSSKLMEEVREKRGLAYSVYGYLYPLDDSALYIGRVATKNESIGESLEVIRGVLKEMAEVGPSQEDLDGAKQYLTGSYPLRFDSNAKIASQLLGIMVEDLGVDYVKNRNGMIEAVTLEDMKRAASRFLEPENLLVTIVGQPKGVRPGG